MANTKMKAKMKVKTNVNDLIHIPAAACPRCGGWTSFGGCSQYRDATEPVMGRTGCICNR